MLVCSCKLLLLLLNNIKRISSNAAVYQINQNLGEKVIRTFFVQWFATIVQKNMDELRTSNMAAREFIAFRNLHS